MNIQPVSHSPMNNKISRSPSFGELVEVKFIGKFDPENSQSAMDCFESFLDNKSIQNFCDKHDKVRAIFDTQPAHSLLGYAFRTSSFTLEVVDESAIKSPEKSKGFIEKIKDVFKKENTIEIKYETDICCFDDAEKELAEKIENVRINELERRYLVEKYKKTK